MTDITNTLPQHWKYVSEGGATIVFSYIGPPNLRFDETVLRLRKSTVPVLAVPALPNRASAGLVQAVNAPALDNAGAGEQEEPDDPMIEYQQKCMERLIPREHLPRLESVRVGRAWLEALAALHDPGRPMDRREKDRIDVLRRKAVLATDLVGGEGLAVEIKPKWAFLPSPTHLSDATRPIKTQTCRFCMHAHLKSKKGKTVALGYCPLDLFSGDKSRIENAIHSLWDAWVDSDGTVNNLKIFVHGKTIKPAEKSSMLAQDPPPSNQPDLRAAFTSAILPLLTDTPVLRILSKLQRTLDALDIEGLSALWHRTEISSPLYRTTLHSFSSPLSTTQSPPSSNLLSLSPTSSDPDFTPPTSPIGTNSPYLSSPSPTIKDWSAFLDTYLSPDQAPAPDPQNLRYYLLAYLLSATFKDCSIILRLDPLVPGAETGVNNNITAAAAAGGGGGGDAVVRRNRVTVIDLDPKTMSRLQGWERLDTQIVEAYGGIGAGHKGCVDGWEG